MVNCIPRPRRDQTPSPQARMVSSIDVPTPKIHKKIAVNVRIMQITQASGTHFSVKEESPEPHFRRIVNISLVSKNLF